MSKISISYIKVNLLDSIIIISTIALSVMIVFCMMTIRNSWYESSVKEAKYLYGDFDIKFESLNKKDIEKIRHNKYTNYMYYTEEYSEAVNKKTGVKMDLLSFNEQYIKNIKFDIEGSIPKESNEIIIEKEAARQMGIENPIGEYINLMIFDEYDEYIDKINIHQIKSKNKEFKIVGLLDKDKKYYKSTSNSFCGNNNIAFVSDKYNNPFSIENEYRGVIYIENIDPYPFLDSIINEYKINKNNISRNTEVEAAEILRNQSYDREYKISMIVLMFVSIIITYNILNIIFKNIIEKIGVIRAIGGSKYQFNIILVNISVIYTIIGILIGFVFGTIISYICVKSIYNDNLILSIRPEVVVLSIFVAILSVFLSMILILIKINNRNPIEINNIKDMYRRNILRINKIDNIFIKMVLANYKRNLLQSIISIISISVIGAIFIFSFGTRNMLKNNIESGITGGIFGMSYGEVDKTVKGSYCSTDPLFFKVKDSLIESIKNLKNVEYVEPNFLTTEAYLISQSDNISKEYKEEILRRGDQVDEYPLRIRGYSQSMLNKRSKFIEQGDNINSYNKENDCIEGLFVNNTNSQIRHSFDTNVLNNVEVGDIVEIEIPVYKNNKKAMSKIKVKIEGIMKKEYASSQDGNVNIKGAQIILNEEDYKSITGQNTYNNLFIMIKDGKLFEVEKNIYRLIENDNFSCIGGKGEDQKIVAKRQINEDNLMLVYQILIVFLVILNMIFVTRSNILTRKKEISILKALGMNNRKIKLLFMLENEIYSIAAVIVTSIFISIYYNYGIFIANKKLKSGGFIKMIDYNIPYEQIIILGIIFTVASIISVVISRKIIKKIDINKII